MNKTIIFNSILMAMLFALLAFSVVDMSGCTTASPLGQAVGSSLTVTDYKLAGQAVGEAGHYAYSFLKQDPKYATYTARCEQIYAALEKAHEGNPDTNIDIAAVNDAALQVLNVVLAAKYGPTQAALITSGARLGILFATNLVRQKIPENKLNLYLEGVWQGIQTAKTNGADLIAEPTEIDKLIALEPTEECPINCLRDKVKAKLNAGGLTEYDRKRLEKREKELKKLEEKINAEITQELIDEGLLPANK